MSGDEAAPARDPVAELAMLPRTRADWVLGMLTTAQRRELHDRWEVWAHPGQHLGARTRAGTAADDWRIWVILAGRGFGKTRAGAEWVSQVARDMLARFRPGILCGAVILACSTGCWCGLPARRRATCC